MRAFGYGRMPDAILLGHLGPNWVALLRAADRAGVRLLTDLGEGGEVAFAPDPAELVVEVVRTEDGAELRPRLDLPTGSVGTTRLVGQPATGFWLRDGDTLVLGALAEPLDGTRQRLLDLGVVEVPEGDWARFTVTHLPGLRRKARVRSLSADLPLPDAVPPRLALTVTFEPGHRAHLGWGFRYGAVGGGVFVPMSVEDPGPDARPSRGAGTGRRVARGRGGRRLRRTVAGRGPGAPVGARDAAPPGFTTVALAGVLTVLQEHPRSGAHGRRGAGRTTARRFDAPLIQVSTSDPADGTATDWFDLRVTIEVEGEDVPFEPSSARWPAVKRR